MSMGTDVSAVVGRGSVVGDEQSAEGFVVVDLGPYASINVEQRTGCGAEKARARRGGTALSAQDKISIVGKGWRMCICTAAGDLVAVIDDHKMAEAGKSESSSMAPQDPPQMLYMTTTHRVTKARYVTSSDPRGYVPVYEYPLNGQWIMMDTDDGYVLWTGIWKADIVKILESQPDLASKLRRVRGGYLKMQGTWMARDVALELARRVAWNIRYDLVPLFGPSFPDSCLSPDQPGYGKVVTRPPNKPRRSRRSSPPTETLFESPVDSIEVHPPRERSMSHSSGQVQYPQWSGSLGAIRQEYEYAQYGYAQPQTQTQAQPPRRGSVPHLGTYTPQYAYPDVPEHEPVRSATQDSGYGSFSPVDVRYPYSQYPTQELAPERSQSDPHYPQYTQGQGYSSAPAQTVSFSQQQQQQGYEQQYEQSYEQYEQYPQSYQSPPAQSGSIQQYPVGVPTYDYGYNYPNQQQQQQGPGDAGYRYGGQH